MTVYHRSLSLFVVWSSILAPHPQARTRDNDTSRTPVISRGGPEQKVDPRAAALVQKVADAYRSARSLTGKLSYHIKSDVRSVSGDILFRFMKPNYLLYREVGSPDAQITASDGRTVYTIYRGEYVKKAVQADGRNIPGPGPPLSYFFEPDNLKRDIGGPETRSVRVSASESVDGTLCRVIRVLRSWPKGQTDSRLYIGPDKLIRRVQAQSRFGSEARLAVYTVKDLAVNPQLAPADFAFKLPAGVKLHVPPDRPLDEYLLPVGKQAPAFSIPSLGGHTVSLANARQAAKAVLINFWYYG
jgi:outer membrane lipoprotein-sorting protein